ncbi:MAG: hypothetical protein GIKADHBN_01498 [Phycisphaerales bacterium]|nr:hypothetical protein [Phycisphaerales bacterium]
MGSPGGLKHGAITERVIKTFYDVYNELGRGFLESVYEHAMGIALTQAGLAVVRQCPLVVRFRGHVVGDFRADMLVENKVIVELKAASSLTNEHEAQVINYLRATGIEVGLLFNFGPKPEIKRLILDR